MPPSRASTASRVARRVPSIVTSAGRTRNAASVRSHQSATVETSMPTTPTTRAARAPRTAAIGLGRGRRPRGTGPDGAGAAGPGRPRAHASVAGESVRARRWAAFSMASRTMCSQIAAKS